MIAVVNDWAHALASNQPQADKNHASVRHSSSDYACSTEVDGKVYELRLGQGVETPKGWRICETYDGHSLIAYSGEPPNGARH
jgi:hypothetical protein